MDLTQGAARLETLRRGLDRLMEGVRPGSSPGSVIHEIELDHDALLRAFLGALLIDNSVRELEVVWPLLESRVPPSLLGDPDIRKERELLSAPLEGTPTELLMKMKILNEKSPWHELNRTVREGLDPDQRYVMRLLDESLMR